MLMQSTWYSIIYVVPIIDSIFVLNISRPYLAELFHVYWSVNTYCERYYKKFRYVTDDLLKLLQTLLKWQRNAVREKLCRDESSAKERCSYLYGCIIILSLNGEYFINTKLFFACNNKALVSGIKRWN